MWRKSAKYNSSLQNGPSSALPLSGPGTGHRITPHRLAHPSTSMTVTACAAALRQHTPKQVTVKLRSSAVASLDKSIGIKTSHSHLLKRRTTIPNKTRYTFRMLFKKKKQASGFFRESTGAIHIVDILSDACIRKLVWETLNQFQKRAC